MVPSTLVEDFNATRKSAATPGRAAKPIRVMHVVRSMVTGGMENGVRKLLSSLDPDRFQQSVCTLIATEDGPHADEFCLGRRADKAAFLVPQLVRVFKQERPDIIHSRNWAAIEAVPAARLAGVRSIIHSEHGRDMQTMHRQPSRRRLLRRLCYRWTDRMFCVSRELKEYYCREMGLADGAIQVIPNGVDVEHFCPRPQARVDLRRQLNAGPATLVVGTVSRLDPVKDHLTLLRAADMALSHGMDVQLVIVGDGPERKTIENYLVGNPNLAKHTLLTGEVHNVADWLSSFDVFVLPSLSEGMSNTLLEAMAVGVASVATNVGANLDLVEDRRSGLLVQPKDAEKICAYLLQLARADAWRRELGRSARERVAADFSVERMVKRYEEMYCEMVESSD